MSTQANTFWAYAPGAALSTDGAWEVSGIDRNSYLFRKRGEVALVEAEHFTTEGAPSVAIALSRPIMFRSQAGERPAAPEEVAEMRGAFEAAMPLLGRRVTFD
jgi:hypothetical protein